MVSFLKSLFGGGKSEAAPAEAEAVPYNDCLIVPAPIKEGAQWRLAGFIQKPFTFDALRAAVYEALTQ